MWRISGNLLLLGAALLVLVFAASARADLLFMDNFDDADSSGADYGLNANLDTRQSGDNAGVGWVYGTTHATYATRASAARVNYTSGSHGVEDALAMNCLNRLMQTVNINHNFTDAAIAQDGGFTVRFDAAPIYTTGSFYRDYAGTPLAVGVGAGQYSATNVYTRSAGGNYDRSFWFRPSGSLWLRKGNATSNAVAGVYDPDRPTTTELPFTYPVYSFELRVATTGFTAGSGATAWLYVGAPGTSSSALTRVNIDESTNGPWMTWTWDSDNTNYISFTNYVSTGTWVSNSVLTVYSMIDNVSVWSGMGTPEPSTLVLMGSGVLGLLAYAWRRRR